MTKSELLSNEVVQEKVANLQDWEVKDSKVLHKKYSFKNFQQALDFTNEVGAIAEEMKHHPDIYLTWGKVEIDITSHEAGGITEECFALAEAIDKN